MLIEREGEKFKDDWFKLLIASKENDENIKLELCEIFGLTHGSFKLKEKAVDF
jgi:hypothetical protein